MKKYMMILIAAVCILSTAAFSFAEDNVEYITNQQFAYMVFNLMGLTAPENMASLSPAQAYEIMANMMAQKGLPNFATLDPNGLVSCVEAVDILYALLKKTDPLKHEEKIAYLISIGVPFVCKCANEHFTVAEINAILSNPAFAKLVAEAYSEPDAVRDALTDTPSGLSGAVMDEPASQI